jgi:putative FmdB family regulatory protein
MAPLYDFRCTKCEHTFETIAGPQEAPPCPKCKDSEFIERCITAPGGYQMNSGGSSTRPRSAGSFKRS